MTTHGKHAQEAVAKLSLDEYDAIVVLSGDGLVHEVLNGYASHAEPAKAFRMPISPIPTGSGNGLALNIIGIEVRSLILDCFRHLTTSVLQEGKDLSVAALNAIKGMFMSVIDSIAHVMGGQESLWMSTFSL